MTYMTCYTVCPYQFRLTHDISIDDLKTAGEPDPSDLEADLYTGQQDDEITLDNRVTDGEWYRTRITKPSTSWDSSKWASSSAKPHVAGGGGGHHGDRHKNRRRHGDRSHSKGRHVKGSYNVTPRDPVTSPSTPSENDLLAMTLNERSTRRTDLPHRYRSSSESYGVLQRREVPDSPKKQRYHDNHNKTDLSRRPADVRPKEPQVEDVCDCGKPMDTQNLQTKPKSKPRRPRKLPDIPISNPPKKYSRAMVLTLQNLAAELHEADPAGPGSHALTAPSPAQVYQTPNVEALGSPEDSDVIDAKLDYSVVSPPYTIAVLTRPGDVSDDVRTRLRSDCSSSDSASSGGRACADEFSEHQEYIDDEPGPRGGATGRRGADDVTQRSSGAGVRVTDPQSEQCVVRMDTSLDKDVDTLAPGQDDVIAASLQHITKRCRHQSGSSTRSLDDLEVTHRGCHRFVPRHSDELDIQIGDPLYVDLEAEDLWCEGVNLRTGRRGVFPAVFATDLSLLEEDGHGLRMSRFKLRFLGSVEVTSHKGNDVITQAINKVALTRRMTLNTHPAPMCVLEIDEFGLKMTEKKKDRERREEAVPEGTSDTVKRLMRMLSRDKHDKNIDHFFALKNVSFCGHHPFNDRYFAFITKHPAEMRFACHVLLGEYSTKHVAEAIGNAFKKFYTQYMTFVHPTEDIYLE